MTRLKDQSRVVREYAAKLPDSMFDADPEVIRLKIEIRAADERHREAVQKLMRFDTKALECEIVELAEQIDDERSALPATAYGDLMAGDTDLTATMESRENIRRLVWRKEALEGALRHYRTAGVESQLRRYVTNAAEESNEAQLRLADRLECLKVEAARKAA